MHVEEQAPGASAFTLVTGASSGIGLELARQAAADGLDLILIAATHRPSTPPPKN